MAKKSKKIKFYENDNLSKEFRELLEDKSIISRHKTLLEYLKEETIEYDAKEYKKLIQDVDDQIEEQVYRYALTLYQYMQVSGNWGESGEQQVKLSFCRCLLKIDPMEPVSEIEALGFMSQLDEEIQELGLKALNTEQLFDRLRHFQFTLFTFNFERFKTVFLNELAQFIGSKRHLQGGQYGGDQEYILGEGKKVHKHGYDVVILSNEVVRTPNNVMSMAAIIGHRNIYIREEALKTIFNQKWVQTFDYTNEQEDIVKNSDFWNIAEGIKQRVLKGYSVSSKQDLLDQQDLFLKDMSETILCHELGHGVIQHDFMELEFAAIGEATKILGENVFTSLLELLADFAPPKIPKLLGPIHNMIKISEKDRVRAERMYYMYISDIWFYNTEDTYMLIYSDLMALALMKFIKKDQSVDFEALKKQTSFDISRPFEEQSIFDRIFSLYVDNVKEIKTIVTHATFSAGGQTGDFKQIKEILLEQFLKNDGYVHEDTYEFMVPFWTNMIGYVNSISDSKEQLDTYIANQNKKILMKVFILSAGRKIADKYKFDHRQYIIDRMMALKISKYPKKK